MWPDTPTIERSEARWTPQSLVRLGRGPFRPDHPHHIIPLFDTDCPVCHSATIADVARMDALFRHGGFGATLRTTRRRCPSCAWALVTEIAEERPPR